jgi:hypothetical protein
MLFTLHSVSVKIEEVILFTRSAPTLLISLTLSIKLSTLGHKTLFVVCIRSRWSLVLKLFLRSCQRQGTWNYTVDITVRLRPTFAID